MKKSTRAFIRSVTSGVSAVVTLSWLLLIALFETAVLGKQPSEQEEGL